MKINIALHAPSAIALVALTAGCVSHRTSFETRQSDDEVTLQSAGKPVLTYRLRPPAHSTLPIEAGDYFHPLMTPDGVVVTDFSPGDHKHHRGVFLAFVEMHGIKDADFWGWGEHAPIKDRRIVNRSVSLNLKGFDAVNDWTAEGTVLVREQLKAVTKTTDSANVLDLTYQLRPQADATLSRWAFSGFCVRVRRDGEITMHSPQGLVSLKNPVHTQPDSDWPDAPWYAAALKLADGKRIGAAVINHPDNPPTLWHNHRDVRMVNPCIVAPAEVKLKKGEPLTLKYRVVTFDGEVPTAALNQLAAEFRK